MKIISTTLFFSVLLFNSYGQQNTLPAGGDASGAGGSASYSVGQVDYANSSGANGNTNEGVQQPYEFFQEVGLEENNFVSSIFPNPTTDIILIDFNYMAPRSLSVFDAAGKLIQNFDTDMNSIEIDMSSYAKGSYMVKIQENKALNTIKIIKN